MFPSFNCNHSNSLPTSLCHLSSSSSAQTSVCSESTSSACVRVRACMCVRVCEKASESMCTGHANTTQQRLNCHLKDLTWSGPRLASTSGSQRAFSISCGCDKSVTRSESPASQQVHGFDIINDRCFLLPVLAAERKPFPCVRIECRRVFLGGAWHRAGMQCFW